MWIIPDNFGRAFARLLRIGPERRKGEKMNAYKQWFSRVVWLGVLVNLLLSLPALFVPNTVLSLLRLEPVNLAIWPSFAANLLILLSLFYIPAAIDPDRYRAIAWLAVIARIAGVVFFSSWVLLFGQQKGYLLFGLIDFTFAVPQGVLLILAVRAENGN